MIDSEIVNEFLVESYENLDHRNRDLIALEKDPCNQQILPSGFFTAHRSRPGLRCKEGERWWRTYSSFARFS